MSQKYWLPMDLKIFISASLLMGVRYAEQVPTRVTQLGTVTGSIKSSYKGNDYEAYEGIPYALPPIGNRRFEVAEPVEPWGSFNATKVSPSCLQYADVPPAKTGEILREPLDDPISGVEDCLYLNIYVPKRKNSADPLPVIFFIHGGSFQYASGGIFGAKYLMDYPVIFVTVEYRLGPFGFLSTGDEVLPGNLGLKDQSLALKWVHENIGPFGGDNSKICLIGFSAGASSVQYHYLSPLSRGKFFSGIAMSGVAMSPWAKIKNFREITERVASLTDCATGGDSRSIIDCLKKVPGKEGQC